MRRPLIAGNWKMNTTLAGARDLARGVAAGAGSRVEVAVCPPFVYLTAVRDTLGSSLVRLGAQNMYFESSGAFTGEISAAMLKDTGCTYVILGHSERRHTIGSARPEGGVYAEDDAFINCKVQAALAGGVTPILCVGETLAQREMNQTEAIVDRQLTLGLKGCNADALGELVIAYEPVWAIGTGRNATSQQAQDAHAFIRNRIKALYGDSQAGNMRILYGGSVKASNAQELTANADVDGCLVGGASLKADEFCGIIQACVKAKGLG